MNEKLKLGKKVKARHIIALMNRQLVALDARGKSGSPRVTELSYLLGRITAHREGIRSIEVHGD